jgi:hypothetical protein
VKAPACAAQQGRREDRRAGQHIFRSGRKELAAASSRRPSGAPLLCVLLLRPERLKVRKLANQKRASANVAGSIAWIDAEGVLGGAGRPYTPPSIFDLCETGWTLLDGAAPERAGKLTVRDPLAAGIASVREPRLVEPTDAFVRTGHLSPTAGSRSGSSKRARGRPCPYGTMPCNGRGYARSPHWALRHSVSC